MKHARARFRTLAWLAVTYAAAWRASRALEDEARL